MSVDSDFELGQISIHTTDNKGHDPEFWAAQATKKYVNTLKALLNISNNRLLLFKIKFTLLYY